MPVRWQKGEGSWGEVTVKASPWLLDGEIDLLCWSSTST